MKKNRMLSLLMAGAMAAAALLSGCGGQSSETAETITETRAAADEKSSQDDTFEMVMSYIYTGNVPKDLQMVEDAINEITVPEINVKVTLYPINLSERQTQYNLMISSGEKLDLMMLVFDSGPAMYVNKGQLLELDGLFEQYCPDIKKAEGLAMAGGYFNGKLYAIPDEEKMGRQFGVVLRKDLLEKYGFDKYENASYEDLDALFARVKAGEGEDFTIFNTVGNGINTFQYFELVDGLGSSLASGGLLDGGRGDMTVQNIFATDKYREHLKWMRKWYEAGYFAKDCITMTDSGADLMKTGRYMGAFNWVDPTMESICTQDLGCPVSLIKITDAAAMTGYYQISEWALPITCENPDKTMQFLNLMYQDVDVANLLRYGIEGIHYVKTQDEGIVTYPEGIDASNSGYNNTLGLYGDKSRIYQWAPADPQIFTQLKEFNDSVLKDETKQSGALGYCFNSEPVKAEYTAVNTVISQYQAALESGSVDPEKILPEFLTALESAGIDEVLAENQRQLDEWLEQTQT